MQPRTRVAVLLAAASIVAAFAATCRRDEASPDDVREVRAIEAAARPARPPRKRAAGQPSPAVETPTAAHDGAAALDVRAGGAAWGDGGAHVQGHLVPAPAADAPPTGRVRVLMLRDGRPFEGGHVCFYPAEKYVDAKPWDGTTCSDSAYAGLPLYTPLWPGFEPVLGSADGAQQFEERARGVTGPDGTLTLDVRANRSLVPYVRYRMSGIPLVSQPRVTVAEGGETTLTIEAAPMRPLTGRCLDAGGRPLAGIWVQAIAPREERPVSRKAETSAAGAFELEVWSAEPDVRVRAVVPYAAHPLGIHDTEAEVPPIPAETTVAGVVPGAGPVDVWMPPAPLVFIELTVPEGESPLSHVQVEGLAFDPRASAWGRLGGPQYRRADGRPGGRRAVIALPRADAVRPLMLWSWGWTITAVDPRGADRVSVEIPRGRWAGVRGRGWKAGDRLRVVCLLGPAGREMPCIWIDGVVDPTKPWARADSPVSEIEFQIVRDGVVAGRSARVPAGTGPATEVSIDLE